MEGLGGSTPLPGGFDDVTSQPTPSPGRGDPTSTFGGQATPTPGTVNATSSPAQGIATGSPPPMNMGTPSPTASQISHTYPPTPAPFHAPTGPTFHGGPTEPHVYKPPTERPTEEYVPPPPSAGDPVEQEQEEAKEQDADWGEGKESLEELERDQRVLIALGVIGGVALLLLICTAHQMLDNPDGCCAR